MTPGGVGQRWRKALSTIAHIDPSMARASPSETSAPVGNAAAPTSGGGPQATAPAKTTRRAGPRIRHSADRPGKRTGRPRSAPVEEEPGAPAEATTGDPAPLTPAGTLDIVIAAALVVIAAFATAILPEGSIARIVMVLPVLFFAPGYLLLQALPIPIFSSWSRTVHGFLAIGISPAIVGLLALSTSLVPGGFKPVPIITVVTLVSLALAAAALYRRSSAARPRADGQPA